MYHIGLRRARHDGRMQCEMANPFVEHCREGMAGAPFCPDRAMIVDSLPEAGRTQAPEGCIRCRQILPRTLTGRAEPFRKEIRANAATARLQSACRLRPQGLPHPPARRSAVSRFRTASPCRHFSELFRSRISHLPEQPRIRGLIKEVGCICKCCPTMLGQRVIAAVLERRENVRLPELAKTAP